MCGIAGIYLKDPSLRVDLDAILDTLTDALDHRGGDATGYVAIGSEGVLEYQKAACDAEDFSKARRRVPEGTRILLAHTRWATQGHQGFMENNHPINRGSFYVIHNGHIWNDNALFKTARKGRMGGVDSEAIPAMLARLGNLSYVPQVMDQVQGAAAIAAVDRKHPDELSLARGYDSPLFVLETRKLVLFGSTAHSVLIAYRRHVGTIKQNRAQEIAEGVALHWKNLIRTEEAFEAYKPQKIARTWSDSTSGLALPNVTFTSSKYKHGWEDDDYLDCDECGTWSRWQDCSYKEDPETGLTVNLCFDCVRYWEEDQLSPYQLYRDLKSQPLEDFQAANKHVLGAI